MERSTITLLALTVLIAAPFEASAGGPREIAGTVFFEPTAKGTPLTWADGAITYYTDRGALSPILSEAAADALVANAFSRWPSISTAAIVAIRGGQLGENVNGANVNASSGSITLPAYILPSAVNAPVAIVYDADGSVTNALLGRSSDGPCNRFLHSGSPDPWRQRNFDTVVSRPIPVPPRCQLGELSSRGIQRRSLCRLRGVRCCRIFPGWRRCSLFWEQPRGRP